MHHRDVFVSQLYEAEHSLPHVHRVSGERTLLRRHFIERIVGLSSSEPAGISEILENRLIPLENTVCWQWRQDNVAI